MRKMWFGSKRFARWVKVHSPGSTPVVAGYSSRLDYLSGGSGLRRSLNGAEEQQLTWNRLTEREAREITDFAFGTYGDGPFYFSDPGVQRTNVLNKMWSMPGLTGKDAVPLAGTKRPKLIPNLDQSLEYPVDMAQYQLDAAAPLRSFYVPIPPGHTAWVGAHGDVASTGKLRVQPTISGTAAGVPTDVSVIAVNDDRRVTNSFAAASDQAGIEISLAPAPAGSTRTTTLAGIIVQVFPTGITPERGGFISGQGMTGADFDGVVRAVPYSYAHDAYGLSVKLVEVEDYL